MWKACFCAIWFLSTTLRSGDPGQVHPDADGHARRVRPVDFGVHVLRSRQNNPKKPPVDQEVPSVTRLPFQYPTLLFQNRDDTLPEIRHLVLIELRLQELLVCTLVKEFGSAPMPWPISRCELTLWSRSRLW